MPGVHARYGQQGGIAPTYSVNTGVTIVGGQLVSADTSVGGVVAVKPCSLNDTNVEGVALTDALGTPNPNTPGATVNAAYLPQVVAVSSGGVVLPVTFAAAAIQGQPLKAGANGTVTPLETVAVSSRAPADGVTTSGSNIVTSATAAFTNVDDGRGITGAGIPANTTIVSVTNATTAVLSANATATATGVTLTIAAITADTDPALFIGRCHDSAVASGAVGYAKIF